MGETESKTNERKEEMREPSVTKNLLLCKEIKETFRNGKGGTAITACLQGPNVAAAEHEDCNKQY